MQEHFQRHFPEDMNGSLFTSARDPQLSASLSTFNVSGLKDMITIIGSEWPPPCFAAGILNRHIELQIGGRALAYHQLLCEMSCSL